MSLNFKKIQDFLVLVPNDPNALPYFGTETITLQLPSAFITEHLPPNSDKQSSSKIAAEQQAKILIRRRVAEQFYGSIVNELEKIKTDIQHGNKLRYQTADDIQELINYLLR